jgi:glutamate-ammonia-ligase adenylyltransferase
VIAGDGEVRGQIEAVIYQTLSAKRDHENLVESVREMRDKIDLEKHTKNPWDTKYVRGGLLDLEFICQFLQLDHAASQPEILDQNTGTVLAKLAKAKIINQAQAETLTQAYRILTAISQILRLSIEGDVVPETMPEDLKRLLAGACDEPDFDRLCQGLIACQEQVKTLYNQLII